MHPIVYKKLRIHTTKKVTSINHTTRENLHLKTKSCRWAQPKCRGPKIISVPVYASLLPMTPPFHIRNPKSSRRTRWTWSLPSMASDGVRLALLLPWRPRSPAGQYARACSFWLPVASFLFLCLFLGRNLYWVAVLRLWNWMTDNRRRAVCVSHGPAGHALGLCVQGQHWLQARPYFGPDAVNSLYQCSDQISPYISLIKVWIPPRATPALRQGYPCEENKMRIWGSARSCKGRTLTWCEHAMWCKSILVYSNILK
jgi:hypothetical protein